MVTVYWLLGFIGGFVSGFVVAVWLIKPEPSVAKDDSTLVKKAIARFGWAETPKAPISIGSVPRGTKGWRQHRQDLQKNHNSQQKQRDSGFPAI